jgi:hypothetical protein
MPRRLKHALLTVAAIVFLIEAWLWDLTISLGHWAVGLLPWREFKDTVVRLVQRLPPYGALPLFLIPFVVIEPLKIIAIEQIAHGHLMRGVLAFVMLKFVGVGLIAFIFDLTRDTLLTIGWFATFHGWVLKWRDKAHAFIVPYKVAVRARVADLKTRISEFKRSLNLSAGKGGVMEMLVRLRARVRKTQG